ncbi:deleted in malignant brain tumors 1 protein-like [Dreissena polymorpha]|uniref:deleted in malignant brain tumors 1 protein-like n=1 Tax=Dreissena polymorpha TaxID=45954 RepID=UPI0022649C20|nr:deleted in malignant brain tumors 1 protein-like [Dreissena polymorpha]
MWLLDSGTLGQGILMYSNLLDVTCNDGVTIHNGQSTSDSTLMNNYCGNNKVTGEYTSTNRYALVRLRTDASTAGKGFSMTYMSAPDTSGSGCTATETLTATTSSHYLTSPDFPAPYPVDSDCRWRIQASSENSKVYLEILFSYIEEDGETCDYDHLTIYDGAYICEHNFLLTQCPARTVVGTSNRNFTSTDDAMTVIFSSDASIVRIGFIIKYFEVTGETTTTAATTITTTAASSSSTTSVATTTFETTTSPSACCACTATPEETTTTTASTMTTASMPDTTTTVISTTVMYSGNCTCPSTAASGTTARESTTDSVLSGQTSSQDVETDSLSDSDIYLLVGCAVGGLVVGAGTIGLVWAVKARQVALKGMSTVADIRIPPEPHAAADTPGSSKSAPVGKTSGKVGAIGKNPAIIRDKALPNSVPSKRKPQAQVVQSLRNDASLSV